MDYLPRELLERIKQTYSLEEQKILERGFETQKRKTTFRINTLKSTTQEIEEVLSKEGISFEAFLFPISGYMLIEATEKDLWNLDIYKEGKIYMQGISSQIPVYFFSVEKPITILDTCAAPGGKTSQLAALYPESKIYAFESNKVRYEKLQYNLEKQGCTNVELIYDTIENIKNHLPEGEQIDMILVDAPCSSEGSLSKYSEKFLQDWNIVHIKKNYKRQKSILDAVIPYLKEEGEIIYSTCTLAPEENEAVIHYLLCNYKNIELQKVDITENKYINIKEPIKNFGKYVFKKDISEKALRIIPNAFTEGFFIAKMKKCDFRV